MNAMTTNSIAMPGGNAPFDTVRPRDTQARKAAEGLVSQLFFVPLLAEMRQSPFGTKFGGGGRGEEVFGEQLDQRFADRVAADDSSGLVAHLTSKLSRRTDQGIERSEIKFLGVSGA